MGSTRQGRAARLLAASGATAALLLAAALTGTSVSTAQATEPEVTGGAYASGDARAAWLVNQMTLSEKMSMVSGAPEAEATTQYQAGYLPGIPRLGIPSLRLTDGPPGIATATVSTGMTSTMGMAATFDTDAAEKNGVVIGRDARALGQDVVLEPFVNIDRDPTTGRGWNTFGEDPLLTGAMGAAQITGIQNQGTMAQVKHFIGYDGGNGNVVIDQQTLHQIYLAPFEQAVDAGVSSVMCSYNKINGTASCGNAGTLKKILKGELGFRGFVTSDWGAVHGTDFLAAGLDMEMPGGNFFTETNLHQALDDGDITEADLNAAVSRILHEYHVFGLLDGASKHNVTPEDITGNAAVVKHTSDEAVVLLKNKHDALPLSTHALSNLALIGPGAGQTIAVGGAGEASTGRASRWVGTRYTLAAAKPGADITYEPGHDLTGTVVPKSALRSGTDHGLQRDGSSTVDPTVNFTEKKGNALDAGTDHTWSGALLVPSDGTYQINLAELGTTGSVTIDGDTVVGGGGFGGGARYGTIKAGDNGPIATSDGLNNLRADIPLTAGTHSIKVDTTADVSGEPVQVRLSWATPDQQADTYADAVAAAGDANTSVVFVYADAGGGNLTTPLPDGQDQLVEDVAAASPHTIVVVQSNAPIAMPWLDDVDAVLEGWFPGDEGGHTFADVLTGAVNPSGHLPFTWPKTADQGVASDPAHPERSSQGVDPGTTTPCTDQAGWGSVPNCDTIYSEGLNVGYRHFAVTGETPLYPFGYGLSYTGFDYSHLRTSHADDGGLDVSFTVKNTGTVAGDAVPQVYLGAPDTVPSGVQFSPVALGAFDRVHLAAGQSKQVTEHVRSRQLEYWDTASESWKLAKGVRKVSVRESASDTVLSRRVAIPKKAALKKLKVKATKKVRKKGYRPHHKVKVKVKASKKLTNGAVAKGKVKLRVKQHGSFTTVKKKSMKKFRNHGGKLKLKIAKRYVHGKKVKVKAVYKPKHPDVVKKAKKKLVLHRR